MLKRLDALAAALIHAVTAGNAVAEHDAHEVLVEWCETTSSRMRSPRRARCTGERGHAGGRLLVEALLAEHQVIVG